ncbi:hypothetical protein EYF80_009115 [Liparis tanakae]|uniref:Uncharacterized protein n=1 Tax=Liparis tanakae TaxID=230148 RepID=A0A4Z2IRI9_9TELE|nr:hypothetical protein EYF80_009115 [Liparis tanakae]
MLKRSRSGRRVHLFHLIHLELKDGRVDGFCSVAFEAAELWSYLRRLEDKLMFAIISSYLSLQLQQFGNLFIDL